MVGGKNNIEIVKGVFTLLCFTPLLHAVLAPLQFQLEEEGQEKMAPKFFGQTLLCITCYYYFLPLLFVPSSAEHLQLQWNQLINAKAEFRPCHTIIIQDFVNRTLNLQSELDFVRDVTIYESTWFVRANTLGSLYYSVPEALDYCVNYLIDVTEATLTRTLLRVMSDLIFSFVNTVFVVSDDDPGYYLEILGSSFKDFWWIRRTGNMTKLVCFLQCLSKYRYLHRTCH